MNRIIQAREDKGLTLAEAARRARICEAYLRRIERRGAPNYVVAARLAAVYACPIDTFLRLGSAGERRANVRRVCPTPGGHP